MSWRDRRAKRDRVTAHVDEPMVRARWEARDDGWGWYVVALTDPPLTVCEAVSGLLARQIAEDHNRGAQHR